MAEETQSSGAGDAPLDLSALDFGPSWAREKSGSGAKKEYKEYQERPGRERGKERREYRGGGGGQRRRDGGGGGRKFDDRGKGGKRRGKFGPRDQRKPREEVPVPEGVMGQILPVQDGLDALAKEILGGGRTYSVFDLAKVVMSARERFNVGFKSTGDVRLFRSKKDGAVWLTKAEALAHFLRSDWKKDYYHEIVVDAEAPKGNFQSVAVCGMSNEILGPPNYHGYQAALAQLHRERFSNMPLDRFKSKIRMERSEEAVNAWLEKMSKKKCYLPIPDEPASKDESPEKKEEAPPAAVETAPEPTEEESDKEEAVVENAEATTEEVPVENASEEESAEEAPSEEPASEEPKPEEVAAEEEKAEPEVVLPEYDPADLLPDTQSVERHFAENHFKKAYIESDKVWVSGNVPGNHISPGLLTLLRETVSEERRYPGKLTPMLCRQLSGRHVAVFKWKKKLKVGPSRPHEVPTDIQLAERPQKLLDWVKGNSGENLEKLWEALLPKEVTDTEKHEWYHDLHWLLNQGYVLLLADSTLHLAKQPSPQPEQKKPEEKPKEETQEKPSEEVKAKEEAPAEAPVAAEEKEERSTEAPVAEEKKEEAPSAESPEKE